MEKRAGVFGSRVKLLLGFVILWSGMIIYRLVDYQIVRNQEILSQTAHLHHAVEVIPARRGEIFDARMKTLAISTVDTYVFADPSIIKDPKTTVKLLARVLEKGPKWRKSRAKALSNKKQRFVIIQRPISLKIRDRIAELNLRGIGFGEEVSRKYPNGWIGSHILGFISRSGEVKEGLESYYDQVMAGQPGKRRVLRDGRRKRNSLESSILKESQVGSHIQLSLDANIQVFVENALRAGLKRTRARNITAIVMRPQTGAILAMANMPDFNPNRFGRYTDFRRKNRAIVDVYEPASAFKIITVAAALDAGTISMNDGFFCEPGGIEVHGKFIRDPCRHTGHLKVPEVLWYSSNVGAIKSAFTMAPGVFYQYIQRFGFGEKCGIDLPAESNGILRPLSQWEKTSPGYLAIGHEISVTPLQMLTAATAIANGGYLVKPFVTKRVLRGDGGFSSLVPTEPPRRIIRRKTAALMVEALEGVVTKGTAKKAQIPGVRVFGKTGTAQRLGNGKRYERDKFNASFVGFFPAQAPRYGIIVVVHDPKGKRVHGGEVAAPIFAEIGRQITLYDQARHPQQKLVTHDEMPDWSSPVLVGSDETDTMPDLTGMGLRNLLYQTQILGIKTEIEGAGRVVRQLPKPGAPIPQDRICKVMLREG